MANSHSLTAAAARAQSIAASRARVIELMQASEQAKAQAALERKKAKELATAGK